MHLVESADRGMVLNDHVPRDRRPVCDDAAVTDHGVVPDMRVRHEQAVAADPCCPATTNCPARNRDAFADDIVVAENRARGLALVFQVLGIFTHRGELKDPVPRTDRGVARYHRTRADPAVPADLYVRPDYRARADLNAGIELGAFVDGGRGMNAAGYRSFSSTSIADNSASATSSPSTRACADIFHRGR